MPGFEAGLPIIRLLHCLFFFFFPLKQNLPHWLFFEKKKNLCKHCCNVCALKEEGANLHVFHYVFSFLECNSAVFLHLGLLKNFNRFAIRRCKCW